jgi:hypothetical protein
MATNVYRGSDGTISLAVEAGPEGDLAAAVNDEYGLTPVGRVTGVTVRVTSEVKPFHELGRAHVNGALLKLMLGEAAKSRPQGSFSSPSFNLSLRLENPSLPGNHSTVTIVGVKLSEWSYSMPEDEFVMEQVDFRALWVKVEDATA